MFSEANDGCEDSDDDHYDKIAEAPKLPNPPTTQPPPPPVSQPPSSEGEPKRRLTKRDSAPAAAAAAASPSKGKSSPTRNLANRCVP